MSSSESATSTRASRCSSPASTRSAPRAESRFGEAGWFQQELDVYGREDEPCHRCDRPVSAIVQGQRATYYCKHCQT
jgi:formamidopyrimidine-DNA glycosylase